MSATSMLFSELMVVEDLEPTVRISPDLTCGSVACVVCGPVVVWPETVALALVDLACGAVLFFEDRS